MHVVATGSPWSWRERDTVRWEGRDLGFFGVIREGRWGWEQKASGIHPMKQTMLGLKSPDFTLAAEAQATLSNVHCCPKHTDGEMFS